ncbi:MAG: hypothetical protein AAFX06_01160 [Planctomycetota bacterium]
MRTNKYELDDLARDQEETTRRRRKKRSQRYYRMLLGGSALLLVFLLAAPSLISATGIAQSLLRDSLAGYGWKGEIGKVRFGWITPLSIDQIDLVGASGETKLQITRLDSSLTLPQLIGFDSSTMGEITLRGVNLESSVAAGQSSLEEDLRAFLDAPTEESRGFSAEISIQDANATFTDRVTQLQWILDQSNIECEIFEEQIQGEFAGVMTEPGGGGGAVQAQFSWNPTAENQTTDQANVAWEASVQADSFPLSTMNLVSRRFGGEFQGLPEQFGGDATGLVRLIGGEQGSFQATIENFRVRNLVTIGGVAAGWNEQQSDRWANSMATLDGKLSLNDGWVFGYGLTATTDFGGATIDGAFPTQVTLTGQGDNPVQWLQAFDGKAHMEIDLAALDRAMPGLIPLRADATLVSGRATGTIENVRSVSGARKSKLQLESQSLRARSGGRAVIIEPIELTATVSGESGELRAEVFELNSTFARASGQGSLQSGSANVQVDFGRLYTMLRPVIDLSDMSLGGTAGGRVQWKVSPSVGGKGDRWSLSGNGEGKNLLVTLPDGNRFKRSVVKAEVSAIGHWNGQTLDELSAGEAVIHSGGVYAKAELTRPVSKPTEASTYPLHLSGDGRLENLSESLRPWLPAVLRDAEGRMTWMADAEVGRNRVLLSEAKIDLNEPRIAISDQWYSQPQLKVAFRGAMDWPSGNLYSEEFTLVGDAVSLAVRGEASREKTNLDIAWKADLERLQASLGTRFAAAQASMRSASYRPTEESSYRLTGRCEGEGKLTDAGDRWKLVTNASAEDLRIFQLAPRLTPPGTPEGLSGQIPRPTFGQSIGTRNRQQELWREPELRVRGPILVSKEMTGVDFDGLQVANDWFAGALSGSVVTQGDQTRVDLTGPTQWKIDEIARRLSQLSGTSIIAEGVHETPLKIRMRSGGTEPMIFEATGELGWTSCQSGGVWLGRASLPFKLTEERLEIAPSTFPIAPLVRGGGAGQENVSDLGLATMSAEVLYAEEDRPTVVRLGRGSKIESLSITREMAAGWLQYLAPLVSGATSIDGKLGAEFDEALIVVDDPAASRIRGRLRVDQMRLATGAMAQQLVFGVQQLKALARASEGEPPASTQATLMTMPAQLVDFAFENGVVTHQRMLFQIDRAQLMTSGSVDLQSRLDLIAQLPLDANWLGSDLKGLAGQSVTFPIRGTLSRPALDSSGIRDIVTRLGTQAGSEVIQNRLEGIMQKQLGSGLDQINSGLEKIFGF